MPLAPRKRSFVALYVDCWLFAAVWQSCEWWLPAGSLLKTWYAALAVFVLSWVGLLYGLGQTPGRALLGFQRGTSLLARGAARADGSSTVQARWLEREAWWTVLLGVLGVMEGVKECTRWTLGLPPPPFMGLSLSWDRAAAIVTTSGLLTILLSLGVLRCSARAAWLGMALTSLTLLSWLASWEQVPAWVDARTIAARAMAGVSVQKGELETLRRVLPLGSMFGSLVGTLWLFASGRRFRARSAPLG